MFSASLAQVIVLKKAFFPHSEVHSFLNCCWCGIEKNWGEWLACSREKCVQRVIQKHSLMFCCGMRMLSCFIHALQVMFFCISSYLFIFCVGRIVSMMVIMTATALMNPGKSLTVASHLFLPVTLDHLYEGVTSCPRLPFLLDVILCHHLHPWGFVAHPVHWEIPHHLIVAVQTMAFSVVAHHLHQQHHQTDSGDHLNHVDSLQVIWSHSVCNTYCITYTVKLIV